jgi:putative iron-regulated protein
MGSLRPMNLRLKTGLIGTCLLATSLLGCGSDDPAPSADGTTTTVADATATYADVVRSSYADSLSAALELQSAVEAFVAEPTAEGLDAAREAWLAAREPYLQTEVYRFYEGPIDNAEDGPEGMLNAWPLDEAYIDYVEGDEEAGIVNDPEITIDADELAGLNEQGGEENIATGFHAVEFLLWGQDQSTDGPGDRPYTDYVEGEEGTAANQDRRGEYLTTVTTLLTEHLAGLVDAWDAEDASSYGAEFAAAASDEQLRRVLTGMIVLSGFETGGERLQTALDSGDQEDEHSCFSDNTHRDMVQDIQGVSNVWKGTYTAIDGGEDVSGTGLYDVVAAKDAALADELDARIAESLSLAKDLQPPFDQEIASDNEAGRARVEALVTSLRTQEDLLSEVFMLLDLDVPPAP